MASTLSFDDATLDNTIIASRYRILFELGRGGTARLLLAVVDGPSGFSKLVVLKVLKRSLAKDPEFHAMFLNEARLYSRFNHPNIVQVLDVVEHEGAPVIALEYLPGKSLYEVRQRAPELLAIDSQLLVLTRVLAALHYAHELRDFDGTRLCVVHRDLTPQNVFLTYEGQVKLLDFGIAKVAGSLVETQVGTVKGKTRYMAPEQLEGRVIDRRADVFACGVILWEAITGRRLWQDMTDAQVVGAVLDGAVPAPHLVSPDVHEELEAICMKALAHDRADRYPTAEAFQVALEEHMSHSVKVTSRQLGRGLAEVFARDREEVTRAIEQRLHRADVTREGKSSLSSRPPSSGALRRSAPPKPGRSVVPPPVDSGAPVEEDDGFEVIRSARRQPSSVLWIVFLLAFAVGGYLLLWQPGK